MKTRLTSAMISTGSRLPWDLCNDAGVVVFRKDFLINSETRLQRTLGMKLFLACDQSTATDAEAAKTRAPKPTPRTQQTSIGLGLFRKIEQLAHELSDCFTEISQTPGPATDAITALAAAARRLYGEIAVVVAHQLGSSAQPRAASVGCSAVSCIKDTQFRDTEEPAYQIQGLYYPDLEHEPNPGLMMRSCS